MVAAFQCQGRYVIRRILRRAVRYGYTFLEQKQSFMYKLLPVLIDNMGDAYPELIAQKGLIEKVIKETLAELSIEKPTPKDKGAIMKTLMPKVKGKADGKLVNEVLASMM